MCGGKVGSGVSGVSGAVRGAVTPSQSSGKKRRTGKQPFKSGLTQRPPVQGQPPSVDGLGGIGQQPNTAETGGWANGLGASDKRSVNNATAARVQALAPDKPGHINPDDYGSADRLHAQIMKADWDNFASQDMPYIMDFSKDIASGNTVRNAVSQAANQIDRGFGLAQATMQRRDAGLGLRLSPEQALNRKADLRRDRALAKVDAMNNARVSGQDRELAQLSGSYTGN